MGLSLPNRRVASSIAEQHLLSVRPPRNVLVFSPPLLPLLGCVYLWRHRREAPERFSIWVIGLTLVLHTFYLFSGHPFHGTAGNTIDGLLRASPLAQWSARWACVKEAESRRENLGLEQWGVVGSNPSRYDTLGA
jgi:hypothetical protein